MNRESVEVLLSIAERGDGYVPAPEVMVELCRTWLALDAAPEVKVYEGHDGYAEIMLEPYIEAKAKLVGQRVRLVATPASGGQRDG